MTDVEKAVLTDREIKVYKGLKSCGVDFKDDTELKALANAILNMEDALVLDDGTLVTPTIKQELVVNAVLAEKELAKRKGVKSIIETQEMLGEATEKQTSVNVSLVDEDLKTRALGEK